MQAHMQSYNTEPDNIFFEHMDLFVHLPDTGLSCRVLKSKEEKGKNHLPRKIVLLESNAYFIRSVTDMMSK